ncbi:phage tail protein [Orbus wheelerorum]|uniref:host specificity protein J n=1 Tax=Orbus wheelerorum TaxID=3074111 RepID=UPI00370D2D25
MGKGGGKQKTPKEAVDNLKSKQQLNIIDLLCEGQIEGPVNGLQSVFLNDTPVQSSDGEYNFKGLEVEWTAGTQAQEPLSGFEYTENEVPVNLEVKQITPIVRTVTDPNVDRVRVTVGVSAMYAQDNDGNINPTTVRMLVQVGSGNSWRTVETVELKDKKTRSKYLQSVILDHLPETPFNIRIVRETADSTSSKIINGTLWSSYTEIYDIKLAYPNTAITGLKFDSEQFNGIPKRNYLIKGMIVKVPDNYNSDSRGYDGLWLGNFKLAWTDNPAWIFYDLLTNGRYGLGERLGSFGVDKFMLYSIGQYCDQLVDDGFGNQEPRFTCNCFITSQRQAYDVINDLCSVFRAMPVWNGTQLTAIMDRPSDMVAVYTNANVVKGQFNYSSSAQKQRHSAVHVRYVDPDNGWKTATEYVADDDLIRRFGLNVAKIEAFGCTSRGQAHRIGKWLIQTEKLEKQTVTFAIGREGLRHLPGDIIGIADNDYAGAKIGGRIVEVNGNSVTLDREVKLSNISSAYLTYTNSKAELVRVAIQAQPSPNQLVLVDEVLADTWSVWMLIDPALKPRLFKALKIGENDDGSYSVTALEHQPNKEAIVDAGAIFENDTNSAFSLAIPPVEQLQIEVMPESDRYQGRLTWSTPRTINNLQFEVKILRDDLLISREAINTTEYFITDLQQGHFNASVRGVSDQGKLGDETMIAFSIAPPAKPAQILLTPSLSSVAIRPLTTAISSLGTQYEFYKGRTQEEVIARSYYLGRGMTMIDQDCLPDSEYWYGVNAINVVGRSEMLIANTKTLIAENGAGGMFRLQTDDGIFPANDEANKLFLANFGFYPARDAVLMVYALDLKGQISHKEAKMYDGGKWVEPKLFLDGDLIAEGTIRGDRITAGSEINAPVIRGGQININNKFIVNENGETTIQSALSGGRLVINNETIIVYDESGRVRVKLGKLI